MGPRSIRRPMLSFILAWAGCCVDLRLDVKGSPRDERQMGDSVPARAYDLATTVLSRDASTLKAFVATDGSHLISLSNARSSLALTRNTEYVLRRISVPTNTELNIQALIPDTLSAGSQQGRISIYLSDDVPPSLPAVADEVFRAGSSISCPPVW